MLLSLLSFLTLLLIYKSIRSDSSVTSQMLLMLADSFIIFKTNWIMTKLDNDQTGAIFISQLYENTHWPCPHWRLSRKTVFKLLAKKNPRFFTFGVIFNFVGPNGLFLGLRWGSTTVLGFTHVVEQLSFSMFPLILTFVFDLILGSFLSLGP